MKKLLSIIAVAGLMVMNINAQSTLTATITTGYNWGSNVASVATTATGLTGNGSYGTNIVDGGCLVSSLTFVNPSDQTIFVHLFDAPRTPFRALYTNDVYTTTNTTFTGTVFWVRPSIPLNTTYHLGTWTQDVANVTKITTNYSGVKTTNIFVGALVSGWWTNGMSTNAFRKAATYAIPAYSTVSPILGAGMLFGHGITMTNFGVTTGTYGVSNLTVIVNYDPSL